MGGIEQKVSDALVSYQRNQVNQRYSFENIFQLDNSISKEEVEFIKKSVLDTLYPDLDAREAQIDDFKALKALATPVSILRTSANFPKEITAIIMKYNTRLYRLALFGKSAVSLHDSCQQIDDAMTLFILESMNGTRNTYKRKEFVLVDDVYNSAYVLVDYRRRENFISDAVSLVRQFKNKEMMNDVEPLLTEFIAVLEKKKDKYEREFGAAMFLKEFVGNSLPFFIKKTDKEIEQYINIMNKIEKNYNSSMYNGKLAKR